MAEIPVNTHTMSVFHFTSELIEWLEQDKEARESFFEWTMKQVNDGKLEHQHSFPDDFENVALYNSLNERLETTKKTADAVRYIFPMSTWVPQVQPIQVVFGEGGETNEDS